MIDYFCSILHIYIFASKYVLMRNVIRQHNVDIRRLINATTRVFAQLLYIFDMRSEAQKYICTFHPRSIT